MNEHPRSKTLHHLRSGDEPVIIGVRAINSRFSSKDRTRSTKAHVRENVDSESVARSVERDERLIILHNFKYSVVLESKGTEAKRFEIIQVRDYNVSPQ